MSSLYLSLFGVVAVTALQLAAGRLFHAAKIRPAWLAAGEGMSIAYVFVHLLPELAHAQEEWLEARPDRVLDWLDTQVYLAALVGLIVNLAVDRVAYRRGSSGLGLHVGSFALYNALIGAFALRLEGVVPLLLALLAFGAHILVNDHNLHAHYGAPYDRLGRPVLGASIVVGWLVAVVFRPPAVAVIAVLGLVSGGMIATAIRDEVPGRTDARFLSWVIGAAAYSILILALVSSQGH